jgi:XRE family aerobic/anaerobic benzoate catabolism transcriptional regulator
MKGPRKETLLAAIGAVVRESREARSLSRRELAEQASLSERFLAELESGAGNISVGRLDKLARALGTSAGGILAQAEGQGAAAADSRATRGARPASPRTGRLSELLETLSRDEQAEAHRWLRARFGKAAGPLVALVGLRGAGKSTIGRALAQKLGTPFFELDALVEKAAGLSLGDLFSIHGEAYYRRLMREVLTSFLADTGRAVLATPGSLVTDREAFRLLTRRCRTVWLQASPDDHWQRVLAQGDQRPSAASPHAREELKALLKAREPLYAQAELSVDTSRLGVGGAVTEILARLR